MALFWEQKMPNFEGYIGEQRQYCGAGNTRNICFYFWRKGEHVSQFVRPQLYPCSLDSVSVFRSLERCIA